MDFHDLSSPMRPAYALPVLACLVLAVQLFLRISSSYARLRKFPGPMLASVSNLWLLNKFWRREPWPVTSVALHKQYGPVVRYGPNRLMFSDVAATHTILATSNVFEKAESYDVLDVNVNGRVVPSFITTKPETRHTALKKHIGAAFTPGSVLGYEDAIDHMINTLVQQMKRTGPVVELASWLRYFAMDTLTYIAFSEDLGFMISAQDIDGTLASTENRFDHWYAWLAMPWLEKLLFKNGFVLRFTKTSSRLAQLAGQKVGARMHKETVAVRPDLLARYLEAHEKDPEVIDSMAVIGLTVSTIHAGADTTASTLAFVFYELMRHEDVLAKLRSEIVSAGVSKVTKFTELNKLPFLEASIKETLRIHFILSIMMEREVPLTGADIAGKWIPGGTIVSISQHVTSKDPKIWGDDAEAYRPDRWLEADEAQKRIMERTFIGFGAGKRICLGQHLALTEMKKCICRLLIEFDMSLTNPERQPQIDSGVLSKPKYLYARLEQKQS